MNGSYGAFAAPYFILFNNYVAGTITHQGRLLTNTMHKVNEDYWYNQWHKDIELHKMVFIKNVSQINTSEEVSIYADTDSLFVSFKPAMDHCDWKNIFFDNLDKLNKRFFIITGEMDINVSNYNCQGTWRFHPSTIDTIIDSIENSEHIIVDGHWVKNRDFWKFVEEQNLYSKIRWNWSRELDFIQGLDHFRYAGYFKKCLDEHAASFGVENKQDFELERISESIINIAKKKYIQHIVYEDGIPYDRLNYIYPKGVELVRSSTPLFARDKIVGIVKYLFENPDSFNISELLALVKNLRKEFDLCVPDRIDDISMQSSCSKYSEKVLNDKDKLEFVSGAHFAVKSAAYHNFLLNKNKDLQSKYDFIKSGDKIKYYYCKNKDDNDIFSYIRGSFPIEFAPEIDLDIQFDKCILSPINSIIEPLGLPEITKRLKVVMDIFGGF